MKTLYLHIGLPKTATTSIQKFCVENQEALNRKNYVYPKTFRSYKRINDRRNGHFLIGFLGDHRMSQPTKEEDNIFREGLAYVLTYFKKYDNIILSDESIWMLSTYHRADLWESLSADSQKNNYQVKIIVYLRRQDQFLSSRWNQMIKDTFISDSWEKHLKTWLPKRKKALEYYTKVSEMAGVFGKENIIVRRFDRGAFYHGNIYEDFLQAVGTELTPDFHIPEEEANLRLTENLCEIQRAVNTLSELEPDEKSYYASCVRNCREFSDYSYPCSMFSVEETEAFLEKYKADNEKLAEEFIGDGKPMFQYNVADLPKWTPENPYMIDDVVRFFALATQPILKEYMLLKKERSEREHKKELLRQSTQHPVSTAKKGVAKVRRKFTEK